MTIHVALLRAVNVGGRSLAMADLRTLLADLGIANARTLLQSGNVVFASGKSPTTLEALLEKATSNLLGVATEYFVRTAGEWDETLAANPFPREAKADPSHLVVVPLKAVPARASVKALEAAVKGRERVAVVGRCAYLVYPDGIGRSKLTLAAIESRLGTRGTGRNWNTAQKLAALAAS